MRDVASRMQSYIISKFEEIGRNSKYHTAIFPQLLERANKRRRVGFDVEERQAVMIGLYPPSNLGSLINIQQEMKRRSLPDCLRSPLTKTMVYYARRMFPFYEPKTTLIFEVTNAAPSKKISWHFYKHHESVLEKAFMDLCIRYNLQFVSQAPISWARATGQQVYMEPCYCSPCLKRNRRKKIASSEFVNSEERTVTHEACHQM